MKMTFFNITVPLMALSYFLYFTTNLGREAFNLPFPFWYYIAFILHIFPVLISFFDFII